MSRTITWLHLSDLHACPNVTGWDAHRVTTRLVEVLIDLETKHAPRPDVVLFTGDAATERTLREALIERSGLLRIAGDNRLVFLHNTLKEYVSAERFVHAGDVDVLVEHAAEPAWQPVMLFAAALERPGSSFSHALLTAIVERLAC